MILGSVMWEWCDGVSVVLTSIPLCLLLSLTLEARRMSTIQWFFKWQLIDQGVMVSLNFIVSSVPLGIPETSYQ